MNISDKIRACVDGKLPKLVFALFLIQPLMDVLSFWMNRWGLSNWPTLILRFLILAVMLFMGFFISRRKKAYYITAGICAFIGIGHIIASYTVGYRDIVGDVSNYIRVLQLPLTAICLITFMRNDRDCYGAVKKGVTVNLSIILVVQVLAVITGTEPHTYSDGNGLIGWFTNTNTQSAIVTMASPLAVAWLYQKGGLKSIWFWVCLLGSGLSMFFLGTRLAYAGIVAMCFGLGVSILIINCKDWKRACAILLTGILFIAALPAAPMMGHRMEYEQEMNDKQGWFDVALANPDKITELPQQNESGEPIFYDEELVASLSEEELAKIEELAPNYNQYVKDLVSIFGVERTIVMFDFSSDITQITHNRTKKLIVAEALMDMSPAQVKLFGIELARFTIGKYIYDVENDFHGIYYLYGVMGLLAMLLFITYFLFLIAKYLIKNFRRYFTLDAAGWGIALIMGLIHSYFTAGVLRRPSASFYLAAALAGKKAPGLFC